jgi:hypothetical protein
VVVATFTGMDEAAVARGALEQLSACAATIFMALYLRILLR